MLAPILANPGKNNWTIHSDREKPRTVVDFPRENQACNLNVFSGLGFPSWNS